MVEGWTINHRTNSTIDNTHLEIWTFQNSSNNQNQDFKMNIRLGKFVDILSLKSSSIEDFNSRVLCNKLMITSLFDSSGMENVDNCPICKSSINESVFRLNIHGGLFHQCSICDHCFVIKRPNEIALRKFYSDNAYYASIYTNKKMSDVILHQIAIPKAKWIMEQFELLYGQKPKSIIDIGAGGGHFVYACRQLGMEANGIETNKSSRKFCRINFGFDLQSLDFISDWKRFSDIDIITFWGVIEHIPEPTDLLNAAYKALSGRKTLVVAEVPRWNSLSTEIQSLFPNSVVRHLNPVGHINCFTDSSIATAFLNSGFAPVAAWYFGMDAYESMIQLSYFLKDNSIINTVNKYIPQLQNAIDQAYLSDEMVLIGKPFNIPLK